MTTPSQRALVDALLRSASSDRASPGAKARALGFVLERRESHWLTSRGITGALAIVLLATTIGSTARGSVLASPARGGETESHLAPLSRCSAGVEAPAAACVERRDSRSFANGAGSSSGGSETALGSSSSG